MPNDREFRSNQIYRIRTNKKAHRAMGAVCPLHFTSQVGNGLEAGAQLERTSCLSRQAST